MSLRELQHDLENQGNALSKLQKGQRLILTKTLSLISTLLYHLTLVWFDGADIGKSHQVRKQYTIQLGENELVLKVVNLILKVDQ